MQKALISLPLLAALSACVEPVIQTQAGYPPVAPEQVQVSFAKSPTCANAQEIGYMPQVGSNKYAQDRAINQIRTQAGARGANLVLLETQATSLLGDMLINARLIRCPV